MNRMVAALTAVLCGVLATGCTAPEAPSSTRSVTPTPTATATPIATAAPSAAPSPTPTAATCDTIVTADYAASLVTQGWVSWSLPREGVGGDPFDLLPGGSPAGSLSCRYGSDPDLATDNVLDLAWSPAVDAAAAGATLQAAGYAELPFDGGTVYALPAEEGVSGDDDGYGPAFLFTADDVRWAMRRDELSLIRDPREG